jgi:predicted esterase
MLILLGILVLMYGCRNRPPVSWDVVSPVSDSSNEVESDQDREPFLEVDVHVPVEPTGRHVATLAFLHGYQGNWVEQWNEFQRFGMTLGDHVRVVALQARQTARNPEPAWFPFSVFPWEDASFGDLGTRQDLEASRKVVLSVLESEAALLDSKWKGIFLIDNSQGSMMASYLGLMSNIQLGGVINFVGCFPLMEAASDLSAVNGDVAIIHLHDPLDPIVPWKYAVQGREVAERLGSLNYGNIFQMTERKAHHHGLERRGIRVARDWLLNRIGEL